MNDEYRNDEQKENRNLLPMVALRGMTVMPGAVIHFDLSRPRSIRAIREAMRQGGQVFLVTQKNVKAEEPGVDDLYRIGTVAAVSQITKLPGEIVRVLVEGLCRGRLLSVSDKQASYLEARVCYEEEAERTNEEAEQTDEGAGQINEEAGQTDDDAKNHKEQAMLRQIKEVFALYIRNYPKLTQAAANKYAEEENLGRLLDQITMNLPIDYQYKQQILEAVDVYERYEVLAEILNNEIQIARIREELSQKIKGRVDKNQKDYLLREQLKFIREELGEDGSLSDAEQFEADLQKLQASEEVKQKIHKEIKRFDALAQTSSEANVERAYIETLLDIPWEKMSEDNESISKAEEILNRDHYGLEKVKERILEFLAVRCLTDKGESPILCLVGPPGTGKTSIARSVAEALNKEYVRICLGGVRDEAEIRGHRKTYVGAMPGRMVNGLRQAGVKNPLMLLDEIDKVSNDYKGDTFSALLEVLDGEQNVRFRDHYVEIPIDLSQVLFIATANTTDTIPRPLLDRMEIIEVNSYTENEKFHIAKEHLLKKALDRNGLTGQMLAIRDSAIRMIISDYTREAGVRNLERRIGDICRKAAREILKQKEEGREAGRISVTAKNLEKFLGKKKYSHDKANKKPQVGIVRGLAWTSVGGETLQIEVNKMPGKGDIDLTGQMGDVMKESAIIAMSYVRSISKDYGVPAEIFKENDFHIHIPEGAVPKDGPSAGVTMATAIFSAVTGKKVRADLAMTGEITLRGRVLPIGGLKEKILAAKMAGMKLVLVPAGNKKDIEELAEEIREGLEIRFVKDMKDIREAAFAGTDEEGRA